MARNPALWVILSISLAIIGVQIMAAPPVAAQAGTCPDVLLDDYGNQYYLPGTQPSDTAYCLSDNADILAGPSYACGVVVWRPSGLFELSPNHEFHVASPSYATINGPIRLSFTVQAWLDTNIWNETLGEYATNWQYEAVTYTPAGAVVDTAVFSVGLPWTVRVTPSLGSGVTILNHTTVTINSVVGGFTRLRVIDYGRVMPPYSGLNAGHAGISQIPVGWTASPPCPFPGDAEPTPTPAPTLTPDLSATVAPTSTPANTPTASPTAGGPTPTVTPTAFPTGGAVTAVPTATRTPYQSLPLTPQPTYTPRALSTLAAPNLPAPNSPNLPPISVSVPQLPTIELTAPALSTLAPLDLPAISWTAEFTGPTMISQTQMIEAILTPNATRQASQVAASQWITSAGVMTSGWISETGETLAWIRGEGIQGIYPISAALTLAEAVAAPVAVARGLELYMPNLWPYIVALLIMLFWVILTLSAKFALAVFGVIYRIVDIFIRWFLPGFG